MRLGSYGYSYDQGQQVQPEFPALHLPAKGAKPLMQQHRQKRPASGYKGFAETDRILANEDGY